MQLPKNPANTEFFPRGTQWDLTRCPQWKILPRTYHCSSLLPLLVIDKKNHHRETRRTNRYDSKHTAHQWKGGKNVTKKTRLWPNGSAKCSRAAQGSYTAICKLNKRSLTTFTSLAQKLTNQLFLEFRNSSVHEERQHSLSNSSWETTGFTFRVHKEQRLHSATVHEKR